MNQTNEVWKNKLGECLAHPDFVVKPRGMEVRERVGGQYKVPMPAYIDLVDRNVNLAFMFAEAAWIVSGSNRLEDVEPYMFVYKNFSDDGIFLRGAYGPKVIDQLAYVADCLIDDRDSRQSVLNIWRERPGPSKDIPCTLSMQFLIRNNTLYSVVTMRSHDIVLGFTYDVFTFSMVAKAVQLLLKERGLDVDLGILTVTAGSLHLYERHYDKAADWLNSEPTDPYIKDMVEEIDDVSSYSELIMRLNQLAEIAKKGSN